MTENQKRCLIGGLLALCLTLLLSGGALPLPEGDGFEFSWQRPSTVEFFAVAAAWACTVWLSPLFVPTALPLLRGLKCLLVPWQSKPFLLTLLMTLVFAGASGWKLVQYKTQKEAQMTPEQKANREEARSSLKFYRALVLDQFPTTQHLKESPFYGLVIAPDPLKFERNVAVAAWMKSLTGKHVAPGADDWQAAKDNVAEEFYGVANAKGISDTEMHSLISSQMTKDVTPDVLSKLTTTADEFDPTISIKSLAEAQAPGIMLYLVIFWHLVKTLASKRWHESAGWSALIPLVGSACMAFYWWANQMLHEA